MKMLNIRYNISIYGDNNHTIITYLKHNLNILQIYYYKDEHESTIFNILFKRYNKSLFKRMFE